MLDDKDIMQAVVGGLFLAAFILFLFIAVGPI